jgi:class 3 adenylate cyclase
MIPSRNLCVLSTEVIGGAPLVQRLGETEARRAVDRCMNRIGRVVEANAGLLLRIAGDRLCAGFERCDAGVQAAREMLERVASLPPISGVSLPIHIGVHFGSVEESAQPGGEGVEFADQLMELAGPGEALASGPTVALLSAATRQFAGHERAAAGARLDWPVFIVGSRAGVVAELPVSRVQPTRLTQRLQIRHQEDLHLVEDHRPILLMGRELGNDVVVIDPRASRQHARIERRRDGFVLVDQSTNGSFVIREGEAEQCVKHAEIALAGQGRIGCGFSTNEVERDLVFFEVI